jgi:hypothetical protein
MSRIWDELRREYVMYDSLRLIDVLPTLFIGILLLVLIGSGGITLVMWFTLGLLSAFLTRRYIKSTPP